MKAKQKVAVFDVDGTIFRSSLFVELTERLIEKGIFPHNARAEYERERERWLAREGDYEAYIGAVVEVFRTHLKGVHFKDFSETSKEVVDKHWKRVYRFTRDLIKELRMKDYYLLAVSHSPKAILDHFCPRLGFDKVYGVWYELDDDAMFTGNIVDEHLIFNKASIVKRAVIKENLTLSRSVGVGDTEGDISFLSLVSKPVCFNPNSRLYKYGKRHEWKIVVERKDVIYEI